MDGVIVTLEIGGPPPGSRRRCIGRWLLLRKLVPGCLRHALMKDRKINDNILDQKMTEMAELGKNNLPEPGDL